MNKRTYQAVMLVLSVVYGLLIATLAILKMELTIVALVGAVLLGLGWSLSGFVGRSGQGSQ